MANCYYFNFEVNAAFPAVCFFHAVKQIELFAKLLFGIYKYMFYRLRKFLLSKEATSHFPRNNLQHAQGRILKKRYRRLALKSWYRFHKIFTKCLRCVSHLVTCLSPSGGSRCLEFFYALVSTQQKSFNAGSKLSVDTTVNKRVEERITVSKKKE